MSEPFQPYGILRNRALERKITAAQIDLEDVDPEILEVLRRQMQENMRLAEERILNGVGFGRLSVNSEAEGSSLTIEMLGQMNAGGAWWCPITMTPIAPEEMWVDPDRVTFAWKPISGEPCGKPSRDYRFAELRSEGKKLGEINAILEAEGYSEVYGEGLMPCPTKSHEIVRENNGAKKLIKWMRDDNI